MLPRTTEMFDSRPPGASTGTPPDTPQLPDTTGRSWNGVKHRLPTRGAAGEMSAAASSTSPAGRRRTQGARSSTRGRSKRDTTRSVVRAMRSSHPRATSARRGDLDTNRVRGARRSANTRKRGAKARKRKRGTVALRGRSGENSYCSSVSTRRVVPGPSPDGRSLKVAGHVVDTLGDFLQPPGRSHPRD